MSKQLLAQVLLSTALLAGSPAYMAKAPLPAFKQMEVLKELGGLNSAQFSILLGIRKDPEAARSYVLAVLQERLTLASQVLSDTPDDSWQKVDHMRTVATTRSAICCVKEWNTRVRLEKLNEFRASLSER